MSEIPEIYLWFACPVCEYTIVLSKRVADGTKVACLLCFQDTGHDVTMTCQGEPSPDIQPEGFDARDPMSAEGG